MPEFVITDLNSQQRFRCREDESVLKAMERHGLRTIPVGCRGGGCGVCRVKVHSGHYACGRMSTAQVTHAQQQQGFALACRLRPTSDLVIECSPSPLAIDGITLVATAKQQTEVLK